ncbi:hypothetical protein FA13DRAFT_330577 [Coprinellus micaceus]|uniref:F-box domain-containing protein n=1 Tax=Coprinellus micaceus TaxID=71717 RepID=A0A4Y7TBF5_COPMI|nr:hypothetical protein FA13DRAFT_330577 [Coprinellus micaceus]
MFSHNTQALLGAHGVLQPHTHRKRLTARIQHLKSEIHALEGCYNSLSLPNSLPPEILSNIFLCLLLDVRTNIGGLTAEESMEWVRVTYVCRHWREVALGCQTLWAHLSFASPEFTEIMLARAKNAPLHVESFDDWGRPRTFEILGRVLSQTERLRVVRLRFFDRYVDAGTFTSILSNLISPAPLLETLSLSCHHETPPTQLPVAFTAGPNAAPKLTYLYLLNVAVPSWDSLPLARGLTTLYLDTEIDDSLPNPGRPTWRQLLGSLSSMPSLQELILHRFLPQDRPPSSQAPSTPLHLANIESLILTDSTPSIEALLKSVLIPNTAYVRLVMIDLPAIDPIRKLVSAFARSCNFQARTALREFQVGEDDGPDFHWTSHSTSPGTHPPQFNASLSSALDRGGRTAEILPVLKEQLDLSQLTSLTVAHHSSLTVADWKATFAGLPHLSTISLESCIVPYAFLKTLASEPSTLERDSMERDSTIPPQPNFPSLTRLALEEVHFDSDTATALISSLNTRLMKTSQMPDVEISVYSCHSGFTRSIARRITEALPTNKVTYCVYGESSWAEDDGEGQVTGESEEGT